MKNLTVNLLIEKLQKLWMQEGHILRQLAEARRLELDNNDGCNVEKVEISAVYRQVTSNSTIDIQNTCFKIGNRVKITNRIRNPKQKVITIQDKHATLICIDETKDKIFFTVDNEQTTWRLAKNTRKIE